MTHNQTENKTPHFEESAFFLLQLTKGIKKQQQEFVILLIRIVLG